MSKMADGVIVGNHRERIASHQQDQDGRPCCGLAVIEGGHGAGVGLSEVGLKPRLEVDTRNKI